MTTHKVELPTLPEPFTYTRPGKSEGALFHAGHMQDYALAAIEPYKDEIARLQRIIDSRPAINAGLPQTYIEWSHRIYQMEASCVLEVKQ